MFARNKQEKDSWIQDIKDIISKTPSRDAIEVPAEYGDKSDYASAEETPGEIQSEAHDSQHKSRDFMIAPSKPREAHHEPHHEDHRSISSSHYVPFSNSLPLPTIPHDGPSLLQPTPLAAFPTIADQMLHSQQVH